jgi:hypothetical protein
MGDNGRPQSLRIYLGQLLFATERLFVGDPPLPLPGGVARFKGKVFKSSPLQNS